MIVSTDLCLGFFDRCWNAGWMTFPTGARVLEIGCAEADWMTPMLAERPDLRITGIDVRDAKRPGTVVVGDVMTHHFAPESFDAVVGVSSVEHIGLGAYGDPKDHDGDAIVARRVGYWLKPGGWFYLDVPYSDTGYTVKKSHRVYDRDRLKSRLMPAGLQLEHARTFRGCGSDAPYIALLLRKAA